MIKRQIEEYTEIFCELGHELCNTLEGELLGHWCELSEIKITEDKKVHCIYHFNDEVWLGYEKDLTQEELNKYYGHHNN